MSNDNTPSFSDVQSSHDVTAAEQAELAALEKETAAEATAAAEASKVAADAEAQAAVDAAAAKQAEEAAAAKVAADTAAAAEAAAAAAAKQAQTVQLMQVPAAPKDFDADRSALRKQYDEGDLTLDEYEAARDKLSDERAQYVAAKTLAEQHNAQVTEQAQQQAAQAFDTVMGKWVQSNAEFMANPLRQKAMQDAIDAVYQQSGGTLAPAALFAQAEKVAFEAFGWKPAPAVDPAAAKRAAIAARQPPTSAPTNIGSAPTAGFDNGTSRFADLDAASITEMEAAVANMNAADLEAFLMEVDPR